MGEYMQGFWMGVMFTLEVQAAIGTVILAVLTRRTEKRQLRQWRSAMENAK